MTQLDPADFEALRLDPESDPFAAPVDPIDWPEPEPDERADQLSQREANAVSDYIDRRKREDKRRADAVDGRFQTCVYAPTTEHLAALLDAMGGLEWDQYIDCYTIANALGLDVAWPAE